MQGTVNERSPAQLSAVLAENPQVVTIVQLYCPGSDDDDANLAMAREVRARGLSTHLTSTSHIASGCVDFFIAGRRRTMEPGARIGVHAWFDDDDQMEATDYPRDSEEHEMNRKYIADMLGSDAFYWFTIGAASADGMHYMSREEIARYGLLTESAR